MVRRTLVLLSLLLLLGPAVPQETQGHYTLTYLYTGISRPNEGLFKLQGTVFLNDQAFFRYDSEVGKAEPLGPWRHVEGMKDWGKETQLQKVRQNIFLETLQDIMSYYNHSNGQ
ncbi:zinc-alpha-2-glycoprotein [Carlito syrichta]|uniref:Zinc-alpha-2-glycoprotein n=1 Tax=Carlito syrichta TaxID=1868482 RepID=A0A1U7TH53_CARSF|nr:zinc-alpha-2-glycoprotein [Carlito syrichta]